ncbi:MAG: hypothetical protein Q7T55_04970, partial [Solirubrobacteraceae bacterium]|nr:hypothetical protein [Solirubrobacteraceae bacterium]
MRRELTAVARDWLRSIPRGWRIAVGVALLLVAVTAVLRGVRGAPEATDRATGGIEGRAATGPTANGAAMLRRDGAAVLGVLRTNDGAAAAALSYTAQRDRLLTGATSSSVSAEVGSEIAVAGRDIGDRPAAIPDRAAQRNPEGMLAARQGTVGWLTVPIAYRVREYSDRRAVVRVFSSILNVGADSSRGPGAIGFATRDMTLVWNDTRWRLRSVVDTADQPTPAIVVSTNSRRDAARLPTGERVLRADTRDSTGLFDWLREADPITVGPPGMGPIAGSTGRPLDSNLLAAVSAGFGRRAANAAASGPTPDGWSASSPIAAKPTACSTSVPEGLRCFELLVAGTSFRKHGIAITNLQLAGLAVASEAGRTGSVAFDLPDDLQRRVLG